MSAHNPIPPLWSFMSRENNDRNGVDGPENGKNRLYEITLSFKHAVPSATYVSIEIFKYLLAMRNQIPHAYDVIHKQVTHQAAEDLCNTDGLNDVAGNAIEEEELSKLRSSDPRVAAKARRERYLKDKTYRRYMRRADLFVKSFEKKEEILRHIFMTRQVCSIVLIFGNIITRPEEIYCINFPSDYPKGLHRLDTREYLREILAPILTDKVIQARTSCNLGLVRVHIALRMFFHADVEMLPDDTLDFRLFSFPPNNPRIKVTTFNMDSKTREQKMKEDKCDSLSNATQKWVQTSSPVPMCTSTDATTRCGGEFQRASLADRILSTLDNVEPWKKRELEKFADGSGGGVVFEGDPTAPDRVDEAIKLLTLSDNCHSNNKSNTSKCFCSSCLTSVFDRNDSGYRWILLKHPIQGFKDPL